MRLDVYKRQTIAMRWEQDDVQHALTDKQEDTTLDDMADAHLHAIRYKMGIRESALIMR